jgi:beta-lactamase superfamily II metal-dependent hydrolase
MNNSITVIDVGHGNCAVLKDNGKTALFDAGLRPHVVEYLRAENISKIDLVVISHSDADHIGGLIGILSSGDFQVKEIIIRPDSTKDSKIWEDLLVLLDAQANKGEIVLRNDADFSNWNIDENRSWIEGISPSTYLGSKGPGGEYKHEGAVVVGGTKITSNSSSIVAKISYNKNPVILITGDMDNISVADIERRGVNMEAPYLIFPHHGGQANCPSDIFAEKMINLCQPKHVIFSVGRGKHDNPDPTIIGKIKELSKIIRISCTQLSRRCQEKDVMERRTFKKYSAGSSKGSCCSGTIEINLEDQELYDSSEEAHTVFVRRQPNPLCL